MWVGLQPDGFWVRPVATAIVWGLIFSTVLTLLMVPLLFRLFMGWSLERRARRRAAREALATPGS